MEDDRSREDADRSRIDSRDVDKRESVTAVRHRQSDGSRREYTVVQRPLPVDGFILERHSDDRDRINDPASFDQRGKDVASRPALASSSKALDTTYVDVADKREHGRDGASNNSSFFRSTRRSLPPDTIPSTSKSADNVKEDAEENDFQVRSAYNSVGTNSSPICSNCQTTQTPLWRRDGKGGLMCGY